jgi:hypothetical protein
MLGTTASGHTSVARYTVYSNYIASPNNVLFRLQTAGS